MSRHRKLGELISLVDNRNRKLLSEEVLGISIDKEFMPSVANTIGTDLTNYKLICKNTFACNPMHVGRDERLPVALYQKDNPSIVSPAYFTFRVNDSKIILPQFLMIIFRKADFDRNCWFRTDGSVRGGITWSDFCNIELPVPPIAEQQKIVNTCNAITARIQLKQKINETLEKQIFTIYKKFFIINSHDVFKKTSIGKICSCLLGGTPSRDVDNYWNGDIPWINSGKVNELRITKSSEYISFEGLKNSSTKLMPPKTVVLAITGATLGQVSILEISTCANQSVVGIIENKTLPYSFIYPYIKQNMQELLTFQNGGAQPHISRQNIEDLAINLPKPELIEQYKKIVSPLFNYITNNCFEIEKLSKLKQIITSQISK